MVPQWFEPGVSREEAELKLEHKYTGNFLIRQSSQPGTLALSVKTGRRKDDIQHFIILSRDGSVALEDSDLEFDSLVSLVNYYSKNRDELPVSLRIMEPNRKVSAPAGFSRGDSPYVSMVGRQRTKSTIWVNSPVFKTNGGTNPRDLEVIQSVLQQGSDIQDQFSSLLSDCLSSKEQFDRLQEDKDRDYVDEDTDNRAAVKDTRMTDNRTRILVTQSEPTKVCTEEEENDEYEDYSLPVDIQPNVYEIPNVPETKPSPPGASRLTHVDEPSSTLSEASKQLPVSSKPLPVCEDSARNAPASLQLPSPRHPEAHRRTSSCQAVQLENRPVRQAGAGPRSLDLENRPVRYRKNNSVVEHHYRPLETQITSNLSKSCSNIFEELERRNLEQNKQFRKSFVRKVSLNLSVRRNNNIQPIRKLSSVMKKMFPIPKSLSSLVNSQENSDSWEYLADCGISPVYEEVKDVRRPAEKQVDEKPTKNKPNFEKNVKDDKLCFRSGSCDSLYESEYSGSNPSSMDRCNVADRLDPPVERPGPSRGQHKDPEQLVAQQQQELRQLELRQLEQELELQKLELEQLEKEKSAAVVQDNVTRITVTSSADSHIRHPPRRSSRTDVVYYI